MREPVEMNPPSTMELFILAAVDRSRVAHPTGLQREAGLSLGSLIPTLRRLEKANLVSIREDVDEQDRRRRHFYRLTLEGTKTLEQTWRRCLTTEPGDIAAAIRGVTVARLMGETQGSMKFLRQTSEDWKYRARNCQRSAERLKEEWDSLSVLNVYQWMRFHAEYRRLEGETLALQEISDQLGKEY